MFQIILIHHSKYSNYQIFQYFISTVLDYNLALYVEQFLFQTDFDTYFVAKPACEHFQGDGNSCNFLWQCQLSKLKY